MDHQSERRAPQAGHSFTGNPFSRLDWPTPEMLAAANRARSRALREMTVALVQTIASFIARLVRAQTRRPLRERIVAPGRRRPF
jgi:hypothetical protein